MEKRWTADWPESSSLELSNEVQIWTTGDVGHNGGDGDEEGSDGDEQEDDDVDGDEEEEEEKEDSDGDDAFTDTECSVT